MIKALLFVVVGVGGFTLGTTAWAQQGCYVYPPGSAKRIHCLQLQAEASSMYARDMQGIARDLDRTHREVGAALGVGGVGQVQGLPPIARVAGPAWNAPRWIYDGYRYVKERRRQ